MARDDCSVKHYTSAHPGAPAWGGAPGAHLALLLACLRDGWGVTAIQQIVCDGAGQAVMTFSTSHPFVFHQVLTLVGTAPVAPGEYRVRAVAGNDVTIGVDDSIAAQTIPAGSMTAKVAPAGWVTPYIDLSAHKAVFRSGDVLSQARMYYRVDASNGSYAARRAGYVDMTDIDTGAEAFGENGAAGVYVHQQINTARPWVIAADAVFAHAYVADVYYDDEANGGCWGEPIPYLNTDAFAAINVGAASASANTGSPGDGNPLISAGVCGEGWRVARSLAGATNASCVAFVAPGVSARSGSAGFTPLTDGPPVLLPYLWGDSSGRVRGALPGKWFCCSHLGSRPGIAAMPGINAGADGRQYIVFGAGGYGDVPAKGHWMLDVTGPWR